MSRKFYGRMIRRTMIEKEKTGRQTSLQKVWEVLFPYLLYYLTYNAACLILIFVCRVTMQSFGGVYGQFMAAQIENVTGVMGGLGMLTGILPLIPMLGRELCGRGETQHFMAAVCITVITGILAFSASLGLNALLTLTGFAESSRSYQEVADKQYGVAFAVGLVLYGLISPLAEEVVFRGVIYNRLRRLYNPAIGIFASGLLFGAFHGNPVQAVYGSCLGMLMAYLYEKSGKFYIPVVFHAVANLTVYITARFAAVQAHLFTPAGCAALLAVAAGCVLAVHFGDRAE